MSLFITYLTCFAVGSVVALAVAAGAAFACKGLLQARWREEARSEVFAPVLQQGGQVPAAGVVEAPAPPSPLEYVVAHGRAKVPPAYPKPPTIEFVNRLNSPIAYDRQRDESPRGVFDPAALMAGSLVSFPGWLRVGKVDDRVAHRASKADSNEPTVELPGGRVPAHA